jgi:hypothetical protein
MSTQHRDDPRDGRCACEWRGDKLTTVCIAHFQAVREFDASLVERFTEWVSAAIGLCLIGDVDESTAVHGWGVHIQEGKKLLSEALKSTAK